MDFVEDQWKVVTCQLLQQLTVRAFALDWLGHGGHDATEVELRLGRLSVVRPAQGGHADLLASHHVVQVHVTIDGQEDGFDSHHRREGSPSVFVPQQGPCTDALAVEGALKGQNLRRLVAQRPARLVFDTSDFLRPLGAELPSLGLNEGFYLFVPLQTGVGQGHLLRFCSGAAQAHDVILAGDLPNGGGQHLSQVLFARALRALVAQKNSGTTYKIRGSGLCLWMAMAQEVDPESSDEVDDLAAQSRLKIV